MSVVQSDTVLVSDAAINKVKQDYENINYPTAFQGSQRNGRGQTSTSASREIVLQPARQTGTG